MIKRYNISKPKKYTDRDGNEKTQWNNIGTITEFYKEDGSVSRIIEIPAIGLDAKIFPIEPKGSEQRGSYQSQAPASHEEEEINIDDIPF
jgi:hypothetical protein